MDPKLKKALQRTLETVGGIVGFVVLMWIPKTGKALVVYLAVFLLLVIIVVMEAISRKNKGRES